MAEDTQSPRRLLTVPEVADLLRISDKSVREHVRANRIPSLKVGHLRRFEPAALEQWIADGQTAQAARNRAPTRR